MGVVFFRLYHDPSLDDYDGFNASTYRTPCDAWGQVEPPRVHLGNDTHGEERKREGGREGGSGRGAVSCMTSLPLHEWPYGDA